MTTQFITSITPSLIDNTIYYLYHPSPHIPPAAAQDAPPSPAESRFLAALVASEGAFSAAEKAPGDLPWRDPRKLRAILTGAVRAARGGKGRGRGGGGEGVWGGNGVRVWVRVGGGGGVGLGVGVGVGVGLMGCLGASAGDGVRVWVSWICVIIKY